MRLRLAFLAALFALLLAPIAAQAAGPLYVAASTDPSNLANSESGIFLLDDAGGESSQSGTSASIVAGTGSGPYVYNSGGSGTISHVAGGASTIFATNVPNASGLTYTARGLVVAIGDRLQYVGAGNGQRSNIFGPGNPDLPNGTTPLGPWIALATAPNGHLTGWAFNDGYGAIYDIDLATGTASYQDWKLAPINDPYFNGRNNGGTCSGGAATPIANAGDLAFDGQGNMWATGVDCNGIGYAILNDNTQVGSGSYYKPHITAASDGTVYISDSDNSAPGYISAVYKNSSSHEITTGKLKNSYIGDLAIDRCYTSGCAVSLPSNPGGSTGGGSTGTGSKGTGTTGTTSSPLKAVLSTTPTSAAVTSKGLGFKVKCKKACSVSVGGSLVFGKSKGKSSAAIAAVSTKLATKKFKLKAGKATTITLKLSKSQRKAIKKAKKKKQKVSAKLKVKVTPKGGKAVSQTLTLKVK